MLEEISGILYRKTLVTNMCDGDNAFKTTIQPLQTNTVLLTLLAVFISMFALLRFHVTGDYCIRSSNNYNYINKYGTTFYCSKRF